MQQSRQITGVVSSNGEPLIGVSVGIKGTTTGTITDINGKYSMNASQGQTLVFSYVGYETQEVAISNQTTIDVSMVEGSQEIDELIVVGYGTMRKSDISGSVVSVNQEQMMKRNPITLAQGLQGAAAGVMVTRNSGDPEGNATIRIRGVATVNGSADPLYVVDGIQVGSNINFVNPADVESIEVLKDASATAIYGARGANGVVLVTTKKGEKGITRLNVSANFGIQQMTGKLDVADANLFAKSVRDGRKNDNNALITNQAFGSAYDGKLHTIDWQDAMTRAAYQQNYMVSASGGNDKTQSSFSIGYLNNQGIILRSNFSRLTARGNISHKIKDFIEIGGNLAYVHSERRGVDGNLRNWAILTPTMDYVDAKTGEFVSHNYDEMDANGQYYVFQQTTAEGDIAKSQDNPYAVNMSRDNEPVYNNRFIGSAYLDIKLFKGLSFRSIGSYSINAEDNSRFYPGNFRTISSDTRSRFTMSQQQRNNVEVENYFTYNWKNGFNNLTLMAGNNISNYWMHEVSAEAYDFSSDTYRKIDLTNNSTTRTGNGKYDLNLRYLSWYGRVVYSLKDRYVVTGTLRRDGSSNFGTGNRYGVFPSAALAWRLSEEDFIKNLNLFSNLKFRLGWGQTGNAGNTTSLGIAQFSTNRIAYDWGTLGGSSVAGYTKATGVAQLKEIDTNLKWETNTQTNVGLDIGLFSNSLNITLDYFLRDSKDLLLYRNMRPSTGHGSIYTNAGHIQNSGLEITAAYNKRINDWMFGVTLTGATLKNKIITIGDPIYAENADDGDWWDNHSVSQEGYAIGSFYGYVVEDIFRTQEELDRLNAIAASKGLSQYQEANTVVGDYKYQDTNGDGHVDGQDQVVLGNGFPKLNYSLSLNASYKNFDAMVYMYGVAGVDVFSYSAMKLTSLYKTAGGIQNTLEEYINGAWTTTNPDASMPRMTVIDPNSNKRASSAYVKNGNFMKLANIQIGYTLPASVLTPIKMESARVYFSVENLACFSNYNKYGDPEIGDSNVLYTGFDGGRYPYPRTYTLGLNFQF